jgi:hypothetical protein
VSRPDRDSIPLTLVKALIAASAITLFLYPLATTTGLIAGAVGTVLGYLIARAAYGGGLRLPAGLILAALGMAGAHYGAKWILDKAPFGTIPTVIAFSDAVFFGLAGLSLFFGLRMLSQRARVFTVLELAVVVGSVAHTFADHRNHHIDQPRFFADWAWSNGIDPSTILAGAGVAAIVLAALMLLDVRRLGKLAATLLLLAIGGLAAYFLFHQTAPPSPPVTELEEMKNNDSSSSSSSNKQPNPVAVVVLHDDLPDASVIYFRQAVLSRFAVDRLIEDKTQKFDRDVITSFPPGEVLTIDSPQARQFHKELHTSVYLLVDHSQLFGIGHPYQMGPLDNPDPKRFVASYEVGSLFLDIDLGRLVGRPAMPKTWTEEERAHYLEMPSDPRYLELSNRLIREEDPRFVGDDVMTALTIKRYLEKNGFYSLKEKTLVGNDPAGKFLFGDIRGYCVHFAHAATLLLRSQGIPARVALGYAVNTTRHGSGSSILIMGNDAHAWPEMYIDGVGWVTFDIYPEKSDEPPPQMIDQDLESMLGELARKDKTGGRAADPNTRFVIPWALIKLIALAILGALVGGAYAVRGWRRARGGTHRLLYRGVLDTLSGQGHARRDGESRERHAARLGAVAPSFAALTREHLRLALGPNFKPDAARLRELARATRVELGKSASFWARLWGALNPIGWWFTR